MLKMLLYRSKWKSHLTIALHNRSTVCGLRSLRNRDLITIYDACLGLHTLRHLHSLPAVPDPSQILLWLTRIKAGFELLWTFTNLWIVISTQKCIPGNCRAVFSATAELLVFSITKVAELLETIVVVTVMVVIVVLVVVFVVASPVTVRLDSSVPFDWNTQNIA